MSTKSIPAMSQDLARIRDNQRRSRARRKEYIEEIETRLRQCERYGYEASYAIQVAARKVAEENKRLRELLRSNGVQSEEIDAHLYSSANDVIWKEGRKESTCAAAQTLEKMLSTRIQCGGQPYVGDQPSRTALRDGGPKTTLHQMASSGTSNWSNCGTGLNTKDLPSNKSPQPIPPCSSQVTTEETREDILPNLNNCAVAADMIMTMAGGDSSSVKADLGCQPGIDCEVDNHIILSVMDRYTGNNFTVS